MNIDELLDTAQRNFERATSIDAKADTTQVFIALDFARTAALVAQAMMLREMTSTSGVPGFPRNRWLRVDTGN